MDKLRYIIAFLLFVPGILPAQTLQEFISEALESNYQVKIYRNNADIATNNNTLGNAGFLPVISLEGESGSSLNNTQQNFFNGDVRAGNNAKTNLLRGEAMVSWTVFDGMRMFARRDQLQYLEKLGGLESKYYMEQTVADITTLYYQLLLEKSLLENYKALMEVSSFRLELEKNKKNVGSGTQLTYNQALVDYQNDSSLVLAKQSDIQSLEIQINRIANRGLEDSVIITDLSVTFDAPGSKDSLLEKAANGNSLLHQSMLRELVAETNTRIQKADRFPEVSLYGSYGYSRQTNEIGFTESNRTFGPSVGVIVRFNLFNGGNETREIENSIMEQTTRSLEKQQTDQEIRAAITDQYNQYLLLEKRLRLAKSNVEAAQKTMEIARAQMKQGAINGYDFRITQLSYITARNTVVELQFMLKTLEINLYRLSGGILEAYL